jgi:hypothetical protein
MSLYRGDPKDRRDIRDLDLGSFLRQFLDVHHELAAAGIIGTVRLSVELQHPWELAVSADLAGSDDFLRGLPAALGRRLAGWLVAQAGALGGTAQPAVLFGDGAAPVSGRVDLASADLATNVLELCLVNGLSSERLQLIVEPRG